MSAEGAQERSPRKESSPRKADPAGSPAGGSPSASPPPEVGAGGAASPGKRTARGTPAAAAAEPAAGTPPRPGTPKASAAAAKTPGTGARPPRARSPRGAFAKEPPAAAAAGKDTPKARSPASPTKLDPKSPKSPTKPAPSIKSPTKPAAKDPARESPASPAAKPAERGSGKPSALPVALPPALKELQTPGSKKAGGVRRKQAGGEGDEEEPEAGAEAAGAAGAAAAESVFVKIPDPHARGMRKKPGMKSVAFVVGIVDSSSDVSTHTLPVTVPDCYKVCMRKFPGKAVCSTYGPWCMCTQAERRLRLFGDVAAVLMLQKERPDVHIAIMYPRKLTAARLKSFDMTFLLGYDAVSAQLDGANGDVSMLDAKQAARFVEAVRAPGAKVCPSPGLQTFGGCKRTYYQRAMDNDIPIAPTTFARTPEERTPEALLAVAKAKGWTNFVVKPAVGSWNDGVELFNLKPQQRKDGKMETDEQAEARVLAELGQQAEMASVQRSPDLVIQKCMAGFEKHPEVRCFWAHGKFLYAVANWRGKVTNGIQRAKIPEKYLEGAKKVGQKVIDHMLPETPLGLIRTDIGCETVPGGLFHFMNEVDTCPGWYANRHPDVVSIMAKVFSESIDKVGAPPPDADQLAALILSEDEETLQRKPAARKRVRRKRQIWESPEQSAPEQSDSESEAEAASPRAMDTPGGKRARIASPPRPPTPGEAAPRTPPAAEPAAKGTPGTPEPGKRALSPSAAASPKRRRPSGSAAASPRADRQSAGEKEADKGAAEPGSQEAKGQ